jgi:GR25 family glycosyltransferase involved in LPS biosynthesis
VRADVLEEFISAKSAHEDYGVVLRDDLSLDQAATDRLRETLKSKR